MTCEWLAMFGYRCPAPATHVVRERLPLHGRERLCSRHVAPAVFSELRWLSPADVEVSLA